MLRKRHISLQKNIMLRCLVEQVNAVLFDDKKPSEAVKELMLRDKKIELADSDWR